MSCKIFSLLTFMFILFCEVIYCQGKISLAVLELDAKGISISDASIITDRLRAELFKTNKFIVLEREKVEEILSEQGFQLSGCTSDECIVEVGKLIGVQQIVAGKIGKIGNLFTMTVRIVDIETGKVLKVATDDCRCPIETVLTKSVSKIAQILSVEDYKEYEKKIEEKYRPKFKKPFIAATTGLALPIVGHAYVGSTSNIIRGSIYTAGGYTLIILGISWNIGNDGLYPFLIGIGINVLSAVDAGISANNYNKKLLSEGFSIDLKHRFENRSISLALSYNF